MIAYGQFTTLDSCECECPNVCYTEKQDLNSISCFIKLEKKDLLISQYRKLIDSNVNKIELQKKLIVKKDELIDVKDSKIKRKNKNIVKLGLVALGASIIAIIK